MTKNLEKTIAELLSLNIITSPIRVPQFTDEPKFTQYFCKPLQSEDSENEDIGHSISENQKLAEIKAIGEALERHALSNPNQEAIIGNYSSIENAIDPTRFLNFSAKQLRGMEKEYHAKILSSQFQWVSAYELPSRQEFKLPAQLVYIDGHPLENELLIRQPISTGAAFHLSKEKAEIAGMLEVIERDAFMISFLKGKSLQQINPDHKETNDLVNYFQRYYLEISLFNITTDLEVPAVMALLTDKSQIGPAVSIGTKAGASYVECAKGAILEAQQIRPWLRQKYNGAPMKIKTPNEISSITDRIEYWYSLERIEDVKYWFGKDKVDLTKLESKNLKRKNLVNLVRNKGHNIYATDITPNSIKEKGGWIMKVNIPELHPLYLDEKCRYLKSKRLGEISIEGLPPHPFI